MIRGHFKSTQPPSENYLRAPAAPAESRASGAFTSRIRPSIFIR
jgi:hypothetical protein